MYIEPGIDERVLAITHFCRAVSDEIVEAKPNLNLSVRNAKKKRNCARRPASDKQKTEQWQTSTMRLKCVDNTVKYLN
jgi:hypothetical protein